MQKALTKMNTPLANAISDISGVSGQAIITAILQGERVRECDGKLEGYLAGLPTRILNIPEAAGQPAAAPKKAQKAKKPKSNAPALDLKTELNRICGVDLTSIDGIEVLVHRMLTQGQAWVDRGAARFEQKRAELELANLKWKALAKGFKLIPVSEAK
jgi:hypothetical protein